MKGVHKLAPTEVYRAVTVCSANTHSHTNGTASGSNLVRYSDRSTVTKSTGAFKRNWIVMGEWTLFIKTNYSTGIRGNYIFKSWPYWLTVIWQLSEMCHFFHSGCSTGSKAIGLRKWPARPKLSLWPFRGLQFCIHRNPGRAESFVSRLIRLGYWLQRWLEPDTSLDARCVHWHGSAEYTLWRTLHFAELFSCVNSSCGTGVCVSMIWYQFQFLYWL